MANAKKCDRCGVFYESYNVKEHDKNTNGFMALNIDLRGGYSFHKAQDLCPACNKSLHDWFEKCKSGDVPSETHPITHVYVDNFINILECRFYIDSDEAPISNDTFMTAIIESFCNRRPVLLKKTDKAETYEDIFNVLDVVYSVNDNIIKLCNYNDRGFARPLSADDILTVIKCYPKDASVIMYIR